MIKLISAVLFAHDEYYGEKLNKKERLTLSGKIRDVLKSQYNISSKTETEPLVSKADIKNMNTAVVRLSQEELYTCSMELQDKDLANFFGNLSNKLKDMEEERQRDEVKSRTGTEICEPGVNCE
tara:strand:- start:457 stop:828 length:372 start_codon:yes stop_codon:yes gene_type:complete